jgi:hypothetical protein
VKIEIRTAITLAVVCAISTLVSAAPAEVGNLYVGTCDSVLQNTQQNELDVYDATGQLVTTFHGPSQNACLTGMTFDTADHLHVISARFGTQSWNLLEFDNFGTLLASPGPFNGPTSVTHDLQGNLYIGQGNIVKVDRAGNTATYAVAGGAVWIDLGPDQRTLFYTTPNGDVKSFDVVSQTQGPDIAVDAIARNVRALADGTIMFDSQGTIQHWGPVCAGCLYKEKFTYQIPANADSFTLDPDGVSFWSINTYYDVQSQLGEADVYRTNIKTGEAMGSFSLQPLTNGRYYSMSIGVNGDGMGSSAVATPSLEFASRTVGTTSLPKKAVLTNIGVVQVVVSNVMITGDFAVSKNGCAKPVKSGLSCNVLVTFTPTQTGTRTGTLKIFDNAGNSPQTVTLSGVGK